MALAAKIAGVPKKTLRLAQHARANARRSAAKAASLFWERSIWKELLGLLASLLGARTLLGAPGCVTRNK